MVSQITENQSEVNPLCFYAETNKLSTLGKIVIFLLHTFISKRHYKLCLSGSPGDISEYGYQSYSSIQ